MEDQFYKLIDMYNDSLDKLVQLPIFNAEEWRKWMSHYSAEETKDINAVRALRKLIILSTSKVLEDKKYKLPDGTDIPLDFSDDDIELQNTFYPDALQIEIPVQDVTAKPYQATIQVKNQDCLEAGIHLLNLGLNPVILNMASITRPGGGYRNGANGQEENIFRRSNMSLLLDTDHARIKYYPLPEYGGIYTPNVLVFRSTEEEGYAFMQKLITMNFVSVAAYARPQLIQVKRDKIMGYELAPKITEKTKNKVRVILNIALAHGHDSIVLGAFGCGAFRNPPDHIARIFSGVINKEYVGKFKHIIFAILEDENSRRSHNPQGNLLPFREIFERAKPVEKESKEEEQVEKPAAKVLEFYSVKESNGYLSNFSKHGFKLKGKDWPTTAHYIEAQKFYGTKAEEEIREAKTPQLAEKLSASYSKKIRGDWNAVREEIVRNAVEAKFEQNPEILKLLIETGTDTLVFHSKDNFFGDGLQGHGKNILGKIIMDVRQIYVK